MQRSQPKPLLSVTTFLKHFISSSSSFSLIFSTVLRCSELNTGAILMKEEKGDFKGFVR
uniref:Uncharacterized protein n=1 Tax=Anguilla anguilla TaxID=7936 RepID=A0A0E9XGR0_ANGAN